jgi:hypothetical protein
VKLSDIEDADKLVTKDYLEVIIGRLENKIDARFNAIDARFNAIDARFNNQRLLIILAVLSVLGQIITAIWLHTHP